MKAQTLANILLYVATICQLLWMSGWVESKLVQPLQLMTLGLMLFTLFILRKKRSKRKRRSRKPPAEVTALVERAQEGDSPPA
ncbi:hypothetical protein [Brevibacillus sp. H7]|uniref:hypothetical protein n=1 Tax=Brevibacillus sp. H7 TaxID=3349138 RepID=UPI00380662A1